MKLLVLALAVGASIGQEAYDDDYTVSCDCHSTCVSWDLVGNCGRESRDVWVNPCLNDTFKAMTFCDESLSPYERAQAIVASIPDEEKFNAASADGTAASTPLSNYATGMPCAYIHSEYLYRSNVIQHTSIMLFCCSKLPTSTVGIAACNMLRVLA